MWSRRDFLFLMYQKPQTELYGMTERNFLLWSDCTHNTIQMLWSTDHFVSPVWLISCRLFSSKQKDTTLLLKQEAHNLSKWQHISGWSHATVYCKQLKPVYNTGTVILVALLWFCSSLTTAAIVTRASVAGFAQKKLLGLFSDVVPYLALL